MTKNMNATSFYVHATGLFVLAVGALLLTLMLPEALFAQTYPTSTTAATTGATTTPVITPAPSPTPTPTTIITNTSMTGSPMQTMQSGQMLVRDLALGDSGSDVSFLQQFLAGDPSVYPEALVTGYFGQLTKEAVKRFQTNNGISAVGRVGPQTRSFINMQMSGQVLGAGVVMPQTGDSVAPLVSSELAATTRDTATLSWTTSEPARAYVFYGTEWPYVMMHNMGPAASGQFAMQHQTTIIGLIPGERYYYKIAATDAAGNVTVSTVPQTFDTAP